MMEPSAQRVASRYLVKQAKRHPYYHGTSSKNLRKILKIGLVPAGTHGVKRMYDDPAAYGQRSQRTFGGVYLSRTIEQADHYAFEASGGGWDEDDRRLIVKVTLEERSPDVLLDEDDLYFYLTRATRTEYDFDMFYRSRLSPWFNLMQPYLAKGRHKNHIYLRHYPAAVREIEKTDLQWTVQRFLSLLEEDYPQLGRAVARNGKRIRAAVGDLMVAHAIHLLDASFHDHHKRSRKPAVLQGSYDRFRHAMDAFLRLAPELTAGPKSDKQVHRLRIDRPIGYRGKNRIVAIVEEWTRWDEDTGSEFQTLAIRYGDLRSAQDIIDYYRRRSPDLDVNGWRVLDRSGQVLLAEGAPFPPRFL